jgi:hypothetical protein
VNGLIKIDVAAHLLNKPVATLFDMAEGASLTERALRWVFDLSSGEIRRDLRFWTDEVNARASADASKHLKHCGWELDWVLAKLLPETRQNFHAGEVDQLLQIRPRTRIDLLESAGVVAGRNFYDRAMLVKFLTSRWIGTAIEQKLHQRDAGPKL